ncbi:MAG: cell division protein ZapA, partial [Vicinamibacteria bacterium]
MTDSRKRDAKSEKEKKDGSPASVTIFGQSYSLRAEEDGPYLEVLARYVDTKMRTLSESTGTAEPLKVAVLAALNIADEFFKLEKLHRAERDEASATT